MFCDFFDFLSLKSDVLYLEKRNKQKTILKKFVWLKVTDKNSRIRSRIQNVTDPQQW